MLYCTVLCTYWMKKLKKVFRWVFPSPILGTKIPKSTAVMPPPALEELTIFNVDYPMLFKITSEKTNNCKTHCRVSEFVAEEGRVSLSLWIMQNLVLIEGSLIQIENASLPVGTFTKFQPVSDDFLDINNAKAVLKNCLQTFAVISFLRLNF